MDLQTMLMYRYCTDALCATQPFAQKLTTSTQPHQLTEGEMCVAHCIERSVYLG
jgi:hypothetical protein